MFSNVHTIGASEASKKLRESEQRATELIDRLQVAQRGLESHAGENPDFVPISQSYEKWDKWNDVETLNQAAEEEQQRIEALKKKASPAMHSHAHDHSEERKFFEKDEKEKKSFCERHRAKGNYLFHEGLYPKAAEQYQLAISYYDYCFPGFLA